MKYPDGPERLILCQGSHQRMRLTVHMRFAHKNHRLQMVCSQMLRRRCRDAGEAEEGDEVGEPRFRHQALAADVTQLLMRTAATCLTASDKMLALGTAAGSVHLLDYGGNEVPRRDLSLV